MSASLNFAGRGFRGHTWLTCLACVVFLSWNLSFADAQTCLGDVNDPSTFLETDAPGLQLLNISVGAGETWSFKITSPSPQLETYFHFQTQGNIATLTLNKTLDLEEAKDFMVVNGALDSTVTFLFTCTGGGTVVNNEKFSTVLAVNEFAPEFVTLPIDGFNVTEAKVLNETVLVLSDYVVDKDVSTNHLGYDFTILPHDDPTVDGQRKFAIQGSLSGTLVVREALDYEAMEPSKAFFMLKVSVGDRDGMTSTSTIRINVIDADDQAPEFWYAGCPSPCFTSYSASVEDYYTGPITWLHPAPIAARDRDTMESPVIFSFKQGDPEDFSQYLRIDPQTGIPSVIKAVSDSDAPSFFVIVEAIEDTALRHSEQTTLWIKVIGRNITSPTRPPVESDPYANPDDTYRIAAIVLGVLLGFVLIVLLVFIVCTKVRETHVLHKTNGKLSLERERVEAGSESRLTAGVSRDRESVRSIAMRKTSSDSGIDFVRALTGPTARDLNVRPLSLPVPERDPDLDQLAGSTEISYNRQGPERRSMVSTISSGNELVPYEDRAGLVGSAERMDVSSAGLGQESLGVSNPVYEAEGNTDVDVSVVPMEQAHIII